MCAFSPAACDAWAAAGFELFSGVNVPSKAFGEYVEHAKGTPSIAADELEKLLRDGADLVVLDSRPFDEYARVSIPTATNVPGAELVLRAREIAPSPQTTVVVNCAGRTRSIIGAQSLINAGLPNKVVALRNGTMGWSLAGFTCDNGKDRRAPPASPMTLEWARSAAQRVAQSCGVERIDRATLDAWRADAGRTLYVFDVRDPAEYEAGHLPGAISAPGGQLVQATDQYVGTLGARIVLVDDAEVRAAMTASWLRQMGWRDVFILTEKGTEPGWPAAPALDADTRSGDAINCKELRCTFVPERGDPHRPFAQPELSDAAHPRRLVRDQDPACKRAPKDPAGRHAGAHLGRWCAGEAGGRRSGELGRSPCAFPRRRQRSLAVGRQCVLRGSPDGRRHCRSMAQAL